MIGRGLVTYVNPTQTRQAFIALVNAKWRFKLIPRATRESLATRAHDQFMTAYVLNPPVLNLSDAPLTDDQARKLAQRYAADVTLS